MHEAVLISSCCPLIGLDGGPLYAASDRGHLLACVCQSSWLEHPPALTMCSRNPCATPGCHGDAARGCLQPEGQQMCGNCCSCSGHGRRTQRGGRRFGRKSLETQGHRRRIYGAHRMLQEAADWLVERSVGELAAWKEEGFVMQDYL